MPYVQYLTAEQAKVPETAPGSAEVCQTAPGGYICNYLHGSGNLIQRADVIRANTSQECNYEAQVRVIWGGRVHQEVWTGVSHNCSYRATVVAYFAGGGDKWVPTGTMVCATWWENGVRDPHTGTPCVTVT